MEYAFVTVKLDNTNALLYGLPEDQIRMFQRVLNSAAWLLTGTHNYDHITPILIQLHWLPVEQRIIYKIILMTFKALIHILWNSRVSLKRTCLK